MRRFARSRGKHVPGKMNNLEREYSQMLERQVAAGEIESFIFESFKLKIGGKVCWYTPDFMVVNKDLEIEFHETKGYWEDDAKVKIKSAARQYPHFKFIAIQKARKKDGGHFIFTEFTPD